MTSPLGVDEAASEGGGKDGSAGGAGAADIRGGQRTDFVFR